MGQKRADIGKERTIDCNNGHQGAVICQETAIMNQKAAAIDSQPRGGLQGIAHNMRYAACSGGVYFGPGGVYFG